MLVRKRPPPGGAGVEIRWTGPGTPEPVLWPRPTLHSNSSPTPLFIWIRDYSQHAQLHVSPLWAFSTAPPLVEIPLKRKNHFLAMLDSMWALNYPTKGQTHAPCLALRVLTPGPPFEVLKCPFFFCSLKMPSHPSVRILKPRSPLSGEDFAVCRPTRSSQSASPLIRHIKF